MYYGVCFNQSLVLGLEMVGTLEPCVQHSALCHKDELTKA